MLSHINSTSTKEQWQYGNGRVSNDDVDADPDADGDLAFSVNCEPANTLPPWAAVPYPVHSTPATLASNGQQQGHMQPDHSSPHCQLYPHTHQQSAMNMLPRRPHSNSNGMDNIGNSQDNSEWRDSNDTVRSGCGWWRTEWARGDE